MSRLEALRKAWAAAEKGRDVDDYRPDMPPIDADYLIGYLYEIGPTMSGGMGPGPVTHEELRAWQSNTGIELTSWQARTLRRLSVEYLTESHKAEKIDAKPPWQPESAKPMPTAAQLALRSLGK